MLRQLWRLLHQLVKLIVAAKIASVLMNPTAGVLQKLGVDVIKAHAHAGRTAGAKIAHAHPSASVTNN